MQQAEQLARVGGWELDFISGSLYWTDQTYRIHDTSPEEYTPTLETAVAFYAPGSREIISDAVEKAMTSGMPWDLELELITARGRRIDVRARGMVQIANGTPIRAYGAIQDITQKKRLEHQIMAAGKMESIGRMAGGIAHDFNNWITAILSFADIALRTAPAGSPEYQAIQRIRQAGEHATSLTRQLISIARPKPSSTSIVDINELLQTTLPLLSGILPANVSIQSRFAGGALHCRVNATQFRQVILNLVMNARDAMPGGGTIQIITDRRKIDEPEASPAAAAGVGPGEFISIVVADTGEGMPRETLEHLFEPFFTTKPGGKGTGLGLATCYSIVKASGGHIEVRSTPGEGSEFGVLLPKAVTASIVEPLGAPAKREAPQDTP